MDQPKFVLEASEAKSMAQSLGLSSVHHLLPALIQQAQTLARPPISNYHVAAAGLGSDGRVFIGVNLEFPGLPLNCSVHAEQFLLTNLAVHGCRRLIAFAVSATPCGHCRQFLQELRNPSALQIHIISQIPNSEITFKPLDEILPIPFGPFDLLDNTTPLLLEPHNNSLSIPNFHGNLRNGVANSKNLTNGYCQEMENEQPLLMNLALEAAIDSHAPYSGCPSGVAIMDCEGKVYKGSYVESAAYNPSLGPVQAALVAYISEGGGGYERIVAAVLVEKEVAKVKQEDTARLILKMVSPKCDFKVFHCCSVEDGCKKSSN